MRLFILALAGLLFCCSSEDDLTKEDTAIYCLAESEDVCNKISSAEPDVWTKDCTDNNGTLQSSCSTELCIGSCETTLDPNATQTRYWYSPKFSKTSVQNACATGTYSDTCS